ncbi:ribosome biogenesis protein WDR12 homolog [Orbicella faveolata]|uniref:ribosome biogenesis protein WDR12 homolog n=1 Tax=Orbicella faveolata TaxID=48498 RepID=UPI0009E3DB19|nr:ribosome biogenesis protein WDR12 homolog [Orbicella faveolata]
MADEASGYVQARFTTQQKRYSVPETPFSVPVKLGSQELNELISSLLLSNESEVSESEDENERNFQFDFLIDGIYLQETLDKHMRLYNISTESVVEIEYLEKHPTPRPDNCLLHDDWISSIAVCKKCILSGSYDGNAYMWDFNGTCHLTFDGHTAPVKSVQWIDVDDDVGMFLTSSQDQSIRLSEWSRNKGKAECIHICKGHTQSVDTVAVDSSKTKFCSGSWDKTLKVWSAVADPLASDEADDNEKVKKKQKTDKRKATTRTPLMTLSGHAEAVSSVLWMDQSTVCSAGWDHTIRIWDVQAGVNKQTLSGSKVFCDVSFSPHSRLLVSGSADRHVRLWDPRTTDGSIVKTTLTSHQGWVSSVAWSPSSEFELISGSYDTTVKLWDTRSLSAPLFTMTQHQDKVMCVNWALQTSMLSGGADNQLIIYDISGGGWRTRDSDMEYHSADTT